MHKINLLSHTSWIFHCLHCVIYIKFNIRDMSMKKFPSSFRSKMKLTLQKTTATIPAIGSAVYDNSARLQEQQLQQQYLQCWRQQKQCRLKIQQIQR